ncbi:MAG: acyl-ACP--UDP-N-acetylglucosamine O-acyltransferase [Pseudomonadota bacterium]
MSQEPIIHPTAIVGGDARLAAGVRVGPYAIIEDEVEIGENTQIGPHAVVRRHTTIGKGCRIFQFASVGEIPQDLKFAGETSYLTVGDNNTIREFASLHRGTAGGGGLTSLGSGNLLMAYTHVAHDCRIGNGVIMSNAASLAGHVVVEDRAIIGGLVGIHQFVRVGTHAFVGGNSAVSKDVPPYTLCAGNPQKLHGLNLVGLKRAGFGAETLRALKEAYQIVVRGPLLLGEALIRVEADVAPLPEVRRFVDFIRASMRGIPRHRHEEA